MSASPVHLWLRAEVKPFEHRVGLDPAACAELMAAGYKISVEKFAERCVPDAEYEAVGCTIVETGTWPTAPADAIIFGLKELPESDEPLTHRHLFFGHCFKGQGGWKELLGRFARGGGELMDLEFLNNDQGVRVAAFGFMAGFAGAAVGILTWCNNQINPGTQLPALTPYANEEALIGAIKVQLEAAVKVAAVDPKVIIMGALGRCGRGAQSLCKKVGLPDSTIICWDMEETKGGGPFPALLENHIFINCIYLSKPIPPFLTQEMLATPDRVLSVIVDVSCDTSNPHNPLPFCNISTTFDKPTYVVPAGASGVACVTIDHLPTLLPLESSQHFARDLLPTLMLLKTAPDAPTWDRARKLFQEKLSEATA